jgi:hypothetical protein
MSVFVGQSLLQITANTGYEHLDDASITQILYEKPDGTTGAWNATVSGNSLVYDVQSGDIDQRGRWTFQAYWFISANDKGYGKKKRRYFEKPII